MSEDSDDWNYAEDGLKDPPQDFHIDVDFDELGKPDLQVLAALHELPEGSTNRDIVDVLDGALDIEQVRYRTQKLRDIGIVEFDVDVDTGEVTNPKEYLLVYNGHSHGEAAKQLVDEYGVELDESVNILRVMHEAAVKGDSSEEKSIQNWRFIQQQGEKLEELENRVEELEEMVVTLRAEIDDDGQAGLSDFM